ncbi:MAG: EAL domain-containing protein [Gammaproteobacteria bacterium]|nr:EAL domain-containing protein [Gammaproteobacteria bacterium]
MSKTLIQGMKRWPLWLQVNLAMLFVTVLVTLVVGGYIREEESEYYTQENDVEGKRVLSLVGLAAAKPLAEKDDSALHRLVQDITSLTTDIVGLTVFDDTGKIRTRWSKEEDLSTSTTDLSKELFVDNQFVGSVRISWKDASAISNVSRHIDEMQMVILVSFLFFCVAATLVFHKLAVSPVNVINRRLLSLADGDYDSRLSLSTSEEIARLSSSFNKLSDVLQCQEDESQRMQELLENKVHSRTRELEKLYEQMKYQAFHDALTGLPNRMLLNDRLQHVIVRAHRYGVNAAVLFVDLDRFKQINDSYGHMVGDELIKRISGRLRGALREEDTVARLAGDEFVVVLYDIKTRDNVESVVRKLLRAISRPMYIDKLTIESGASIGVSFFPEAGHTPAELIKNADIAMYQAKKSLHKQYAFYDVAIGKENSRRLNIMQDVAFAVRNNELQVQYQIIKNIETNQCSGVEALARWLHPELGMISPGDFIPIAEEIGVVTQIDLWVLETACRELSEYNLTHNKNYFISVNLSSNTFQSTDLIEKISCIVERMSTPMPDVQIEITENTYLQEVELVFENIQRLKTLGFRIAVDDFGSGYASFSYLTRLPIDTVKIDKQFMHRVTSNDNSHTIAKAIINLGNKLGLMVIAEGVENQDQEKFLLEQQCSSAQGFWYGSPVGIQDLAVDS